MSAGQGISHRPTVSVVVTSRNDNHGGDPLARLQACIDSLIRQARVHDLRVEFILVEWNPPQDRAPLRDVLSLPGRTPGFALRVITVPARLHDELPNAEVLPLFQMIAKNVGIRRASGDYILATNIDVVLSEELAGLLAGPLRDDVLYRAWRFDIPPEEHQSAADGSPSWSRVNGPAGTRSRSRIPFLDILLVSRFPLLNLVGRQALARASFRSRALWVRCGLVRASSRLRTWPRRAADLLRRARPSKIARGRHSLPGLLRRLVEASSGLVVLLVRSLSSRRPKRARLQQLVLKMRSLIDRPFTNACGDFTLMSRENWMLLRGYPEWPIFSWHLDSVLLLQAQALGITEVVLPHRLRAYHLDHSLGSGYSPEGADMMFARLDGIGLPYLRHSDVVGLTSALRSGHGRVPGPSARPIFNRPDWGLASHRLEEWSPSAPMNAPSAS